MRKENIKGVYDGVIREILYYSERLVTEGG